jgi:hypothetical protein
LLASNATLPDLSTLDSDVSMVLASMTSPEAAAASGDMQLPADQPADPGEQLYTLPGLAGDWHLQQLVEMELQRDPRLSQVPPAAAAQRCLSQTAVPPASCSQQSLLAHLSTFLLFCLPCPQVRRSALPPEFWEARRRARNHNRMQRNYGRRRRHGEALRQEEYERLEGMPEEQAAAYQQQKEAEREAAKTAAAAQREAVQQALEHGLRVVVDCSFSVPHVAAGGVTGGDDADTAEDGDRSSSSQISTDTAAVAAAAAAASDREVRSLCKQLQLCAAANKRAPRPVSLQFSSFCGPVRRFAVEGMHADRWPAARCLEQPLLELFGGDELVVLSPDAQEPLLSLDFSKVSPCPGLLHHC